METILLVVHVLVVLALIVVVLLQRSEGGGLGIGGGGGGGLVSVRGSANMLTRATATLAVIFFTTSLILAIMASNQQDTRSILDEQPAPVSQPVEPEQPTEPGVPLSD